MGDNQVWPLLHSDDPAETGPGKGEQFLQEQRAFSRVYDGTTKHRKQLCACLTWTKKILSKKKKIEFFGQDPLHLESPRFSSKMGIKTFSENLTFKTGLFYLRLSVVVEFSSCQC